MTEVLVVSREKFAQTIEDVFNENEWILTNREKCLQLNGR